MNDYPPGWYHDPDRPGKVAYFDGHRIHDGRHDADPGYVDPAGNQAAQPTAPAHRAAEPPPRPTGAAPADPDPAGHGTAGAGAGTQAGNQAAQQADVADTPAHTGLLARQPARRVLAAAGAAVVLAGAGAMYLTGGSALCDTVAQLEALDLETADRSDSGTYATVGAWYGDVADVAGDHGQIAAQTGQAYRQAADDIAAGTPPATSAALETATVAVRRPDLGLGAQLASTIADSCADSPIRDLTHLR